jgi:alpha-methylacyl-CoA racemase
MLAAVGILSAVYARQHTGSGQVVDAAMLDGVALLAAKIHGLRTTGTWSDRAGTNFLDSGAPFYDTYETADGQHMAVGALEPKFYDELLTRFGLESAGLPAQYDRSGWPVLRARLTQAFAERTQAELVELFEGSDACVAPVLSPGDAPSHPHNAARNTFIKVGGVLQPAPAPRFGRTPAAAPSPPVKPGADTDAVLAGLGLSAREITALRDRGVAS